MKRMNLLFTGIMLTGLLLFACSKDSGMEPPAPDPEQVEILALVSPTPFTAEGNRHLVYEIEIKNPGQSIIEIEQLEILDGDKQLAVYQGQALNDLMLPFFTPSINSGQRGLIYLWLTVVDNSLPATLRHNVTLAGANAPETFDLAVDTSVPLALGPPLKGEFWLTVGGSNSSDHRRSFYYFNDSFFLAQRFALDFAQLGPDLETYSGNPLDNSSYHAYGAEILAVHDGVIVAAKDGMADNIPPQVPPYDPETAPGNFVVLDIGNGQFAFYAHLIPGSIRVQVGQTVRKGDTLGLVGNSGTSDQAHLHFHIAEAFDINSSPTINAIQGLPYVFESFEVQGNRPVLGDRSAELPLDYGVIRFPN